MFHVAGLDCATEATALEGALRSVQGVCSVRASGATGKATVVHTLAEGEIQRAL